MSEFALNQQTRYYKLLASRFGRMKRIFPKCIFAFIVLCISNLPSHSQDWKLNFAQALDQAKKENKLVLLNFSGSDWCGPCIKMKKEVFANDNFKSFAESNLIMVNADFPRYKKNRLSDEQTAHNEALAEKYNSNGVFPLTIVFGGDEKSLIRWEGYPRLTPDQFIDQIKKVAPKAPATNELKKFSKQKLLMGSRFSITVVSESWEKAEPLINDAYAYIAELESKISSWDPNSQTSQINANAGIKPVKVDPELFGLIQRSKMISNLTQGAFDISFGSISKNVWHFDGSMTAWPDSAEVLDAVKLIDYQNIILDTAEQTVFLKNKGMRIGFGAIGKGFAAKLTSDRLKAKGVKSGVVNAGGDLYCWGSQPSGEPWLISLADPDDMHQALSQLPLSNMAAVTSGNYEKFIQIDGVKYCHILDPRTGYPVKNLRSVTIVTQNPEFADALATSVFVLGREVGLDMVDQLEGVECIIIDETNEIHTSKNVALKQ